MHGVFYCTRAALRFMEPQRSGRIVNIASIAGLGAGSMHSPGYSATKAGVISLTRTTAFDVAGANIFVNAIACGGVNTPPMQAFLDGSTAEQRASLFQLVPLGVSRMRRNTPNWRSISPGRSITSWVKCSVRTADM
jgi:3-oxoacyl-[acyl-carrier protein] reductase